MRWWPIVWILWKVATTAKHMQIWTMYHLVSYTAWPLYRISQFGADVIGKVVPKTLNRHEYILVAIDYFTKWVEAASYFVLKVKRVARFIEINIICWFWVPQEIISDNGSHFEGEVTRIT